MVTMSGVWDRTVEVIAARRSLLVGLTLLLIWLPGLILSALRFAVLGVAAADQGNAGAPWLGVLGLVVTLVAVVGQLALVAAASDAATGRREAVAVALRRFGPYVGTVLLIVVAMAVLAMPLLVVVFSAYPNLAALEAGGPPPLTGGAALFAVLYGLALLVLLVWVQARLLSVLAPVIVNERRGFGSIARAFRLTRGLTWRIVGVVLLFALVAGVAILATRGVVGVALRLIFGFQGMTTALFLTGAIVSLVGCAVSLVVTTFTARLYVAIVGTDSAGSGGRWPAA